MDLADVVRRATLNPALILGEADEIGTLAPGSRADIAILDLAEGRWTLTDSLGEELVVDRRLVPETVFREGRQITPDRRLLRDVCSPEMRAAA